MKPTPATTTVEDSVRACVLTWTGRRVRGLAVIVRGQTLVLTGRASSFHVKQLAQRGAQDILPQTPLANEIVVESSGR